MQVCCVIRRQGLAGLFACVFALLLCSPAAAQSGGVGISFQQQDGNWVVVAVTQGGPADEAGVPVGAVLRDVGGSSVDGLTFEQLAARLRGRIGSKVTLEFRTDDGMREFELARADLSNLRPAPPPQDDQDDGWQGDDEADDEPRRGSPRPARLSPDMERYAADLSDVARVLGVTPELVREHGAPEAIKPGVRLLYEVGSSHSIEGGDFITDPNFILTGGGAGVLTLDVASVEGPVAMLVGQQFGYNPETRQFESVLATTCMTGPASALSDYWIHPAILATVDTTSAFRVRRGKYDQNGRTYNVLRVRVAAGSRTSQWMFDTDSGLLLCFRSGSTISTISGTEEDEHDWEGIAFNHVTFVGMREIEWPGAGGEVPEWAREARSMRFRGHHYVALDGGPTTPASAMETEFRIDAAGSKFIAGTLFDTLAEAREGHDALTRRPFGSGTAGPGFTFMPVAAWRGLREGQVLDRESAIGAELVVASKSDEHVVIELRHPNILVRRVYDREGRMIMVEQAVRQYTGWQGWVLNLVGIE